MSKLKPIDGDRLIPFCIREFCVFAKKWREPRDLERLAISFASNGYPICGRGDTLTILSLVAIFPELIKREGERWAMFLVFYKRAPDFVLGFLVHLRAKLAIASDHRRHMLLSPVAHPPKTVKASLKKATTRDAIEKENKRQREMVSSVQADQKRASDFLHSEFLKNSTRQKRR